MSRAGQVAVLPGQDGAWEVALDLTLHGEPVPWSRSTNPRTGGRFIPGKQARAAGRIAELWERAGGPRLDRPTPVVLSAAFFTERPRGHYGTGRNAGVVKDRYLGARPTTRPDFSNLVKLVEDALTTLLWRDDDQIVGYVPPIGLWYCDEGPRSEVAAWVPAGSAVRFTVEVPNREESDDDRGGGS